MPEEVKKEIKEERKTFEERYTELLDLIRALQAELEGTLYAVYDIDRQIAELEDLKEILFSLKKLGAGKQTLVDLGPAMVKMEIVDAEHIFMDIGGGMLIELSLEEAKKVIDDKIEELNSIKANLLKKAAVLRRQIEELIEKVRKVGEEKGKAERQ